MRKPQLLCLLLVFVILLTAVPPALAADNGYATRGEIVEMLLVAADDYRANLSKSEIIRGYGDGELKEDQFVTRAEAFVMISRAFGALELPTGHNARSSVTDISFDDVPAWAAADVRNLVQGGALVGTAEDKLSPQDTVTKEQMDLIIKRIFALKATNIKDDFYAAHNRETLANTEIKPGYGMDGTVVGLVDYVDQSIQAIIENIVGKSHNAGSTEQKIADYYHNIINLEARNAACLQPVEGYLAEAQAAQNLADLLALRSKLVRETGMTMLLAFAPVADLKDSTKYTMVFATSSPNLPKDTYSQPDAPQMAAYLDYVRKLFRHSGLTETEAVDAAQTVVEIETRLAAAMLDAQDYANANKLYNPYPMAELQKLFPQVDLQKLAKDDGYQTIEQAVVYDVGMMEAAAALLTEDYLQELKIWLQFGILSSVSGVLCEDMIQIGNEFNQAYLGIAPVEDIKATARAAIQNTMSDYLGKIYAETYFSATAKADVEGMVRDFIEIYSSRIKTLTWMSEATKALAQKKLDSMTVKVGYPDVWEDSLAEVKIAAIANGGSYYANVMAINSYNQRQTVARQGQEVDKSKWFTPVYTVDAYFNPQGNEIIFPAGILQAPFYDVEASREENLGGVGFIIAHEITHCFDNNGAQFDENGNATDWWTAEDYAAFEQLCSQAVDFYDGLEAAPGIANDGTLTLSENIADLGAMHCITEAASRLESPDYRKMYDNLAYSWAASATREIMAYLAVADVHSWRNIRVNRNLQAVDAFFETYGIQAGDGMYIAPENRLRIW